MSSILKISEAVSLGIHACVIIAQAEARISRQEIAERLKASEHHLAKVLHRLVKHGLIQSSTGPGGGFSLAQSRGNISLMQIYEAIEGAFPGQNCLFNQTSCTFSKCPMGPLLGSINQQVRDYFEQTTLESMV